MTAVLDVDAVLIVIIPVVVATVVVVDEDAMEIPAAELDSGLACYGIKVGLVTGVAVVVG